MLSATSWRRLAVEESIPPDRLVRLHREALQALVDPPSGVPDLARLAYHAEGAGDAEARPRVRTRGRRAGRRARGTSGGGRAIRRERFGSPTTQRPRLRAELLERRSYECYVTDQFVDAVAAQRQAVDLLRDIGDPRREGAALCSFARRVWCGGADEEAHRASVEAVAVLEKLPPGRELAIAYGVSSSICMNREDAEGTMRWGTRATELAERLDEAEALAYSLNNVGTIEDSSRETPQV